MGSGLGLGLRVHLQARMRSPSAASNPNPDPGPHPHQVSERGLEEKRAEKHHLAWVAIRAALTEMEMSLTNMGERDLPVLSMGEPRYGQGHLSLTLAPAPATAPILTLALP